MSFRLLCNAVAAGNARIFNAQQHRSCGLLPALPLLSVLTFVYFGAPALAQTATEQACFNAVQGKVAWAQGGSTSWGPENVMNLCRGVVDYHARIACFTDGIASHNDWARATGDCQAVGALTPSPGATSPVGTAVRIESSVDRSRAINVLDSENPVASALPTNLPSTQWIIAPIPGTHFYRLSSVVRPNLFLNNQGGILTTSMVQDGWWSAQWTIESAPDGSGNWRICNRWTSECLKLADGDLALAPAAPGDAEALWVIPGFGAAQTVTPAPAPEPAAPTATEQACYTAVQGKVAWNRAGDTSWDPANIKNLCKGAVDPRARIACFTARIGKLDNWAKAIEGCATSGTTVASSGGTSSAPPLSAANSGTANEQACFNAVQGKVAWNRAGATLWPRATLTDLCKGAVDYPTRISCFQGRIVSHGDVLQAIVDCRDTGTREAVTIVATAQEQACKSEVLGPRFRNILSSDEPNRQAQAEHLCRRVVNIPARLSCFENYLGKTNSVIDSIQNCGRSGTTAHAKKVFRLESLLVAETTESGYDEIYLLIAGESKDGVTRIPEGKTTSKVAPAGNVNTTYFYPSMSMKPDDPSLRLWNICRIVTPMPNGLASVIVRDKDWDYNREDDSNLANRDDLIGQMAFSELDHLTLNWWTDNSYGRHVAKLVNNGIYYMTYQVAETAEELPACKPSKMRDLAIEEIRNSITLSPCEKKCNMAFNGDPFGQCDIGPSEPCSSIALVYVGCVLVCEASGQTGD